MRHLAPPSQDLQDDTPPLACARGCLLGTALSLPLWLGILALAAWLAGWRLPTGLAALWP